METLYLMFKGLEALFYLSVIVYIVRGWKQ